MSRLTLLALTACMLAPLSASYAVVVPSLYNNEIFAYYPPDGDVENDPNIDTAFDDWDNVPVGFTDPEDNPGAVDFKNIKLANDENYLYIYIEHFGEQSLDTYISIDTDQDITTGFDIFGFGLVGAEASWVNDFPFSQLNGAFNEGPLYGGPFGNGGAPIFPFFNLNGSEREWMIPLDVTHDAEGTIPVFTQDTVDILIWNESGGGELLGTAPEFDTLTYTLAAAPEVAGDYNDDGLVNAADYTVWRDSEGDIGEGLAADGDGDMDVDQDDRTIWADNYGAGGTAASVAVPEPASIVTGVLALMAVMVGRRSNSSDR